MKLRLSTSLICLFFFAFSLNTALAVGTVQHQLKSSFAKAINADELGNLTSEDFLDLTPRKVSQLTGKKMKFKERIALKIAKKQLKKSLKKEKNNAGINDAVYIVLSIFALGWVAIGLLTNWEGFDWVISLLLYLLGFLPGVIYALVRKNDYL